jgi:hypothetical protein
MRLWRRERRSDQPQPEAVSDEQPVEPQPGAMSTEQRLEQVLYQLADEIDDHGDDPKLRWSRQVREAADLIGRGELWGYKLFRDLFREQGRPGDHWPPIPNPFTEQPFARTGTCDEAVRLADEALREKAERSSNAPDREIVLRPWREGSIGRAVVYEDGTVVATEDRDGGDPRIPDIKAASRPDEDPVAELAIRSNGLCATYSHRCDRPWLAARLREHDPKLRLEQPPPRWLN